MQNIYASHGMLLLINKLRANHSIMWVWALSLKSDNVPAIVNLLIQRKILKVHGHRSQKVITPTKRGKTIINSIVTQSVSLNFRKLHRYRDIEILLALFIGFIGFLAMGFNRWWLLRKCPAMIDFTLGGICLPCYFFAMTDLQIATLSNKVKRNNTLNKLKILFHKNNFKWTHNIQKYCTSK